MAARKAGGRKAVPNSTKSIPGAKKRASETAPDLQEAQRRNFANVRKRKPEEDRDNPKNVEARRQRAAQRKTEEVEAREKLLEDTFVPVADARQQRAKRATEERIKEGERAAKGQTPFKPPSSPDEKGFIAEPAHPEKPGPRGSAPRSPGTPDGPQGEDVIYVTDDIAEDGTPLVSPGFVEPTPEWDGEANRDYNELYEKLGRKWSVGTAEPVQLVDEDDEPVNSHSPEGAELDSIKTGRKVKFVPNDAWLDPVHNDPRRLDE
jgi:hypothetical protein